MAAHQAPPSLGFSRQEHWSGLPFPSPMHESEKWKWSRSVVSDSSPWAAAYQAPPSMGFSRQEYWSGVSLPSPQRSLVGYSPWGRKELDTTERLSTAQHLVSLFLWCLHFPKQFLNLIHEKPPSGNTIKLYWKNVLKGIGFFSTSHLVTALWSPHFL